MSSVSDVETWWKAHKSLKIESTKVTRLKGYSLAAIGLAYGSKLITSGRHEWKVKYSQTGSTNLRRIGIVTNFDKLNIYFRIVKYNVCYEGYYSRIQGIIESKYVSYIHYNII